MKTRCLRVILALAWLAGSAASAAEQTCFESRKDASELTPHASAGGAPSVKCSPTTGAVLWWGDPFDGTIALGEPAAAGVPAAGKAVVRPREASLSLIDACGVACHNGTSPPPPKDRNPRALTMHEDIVPDALALQHGRGAIWCLDCHHPLQRKKLIDNFGQPIGFNEPQQLCGKCHGPILRDWRDGIHGKRIGEWAANGRKRWFVCTECHDPHDVQQGARNSGFAQLQPEPAPLPPDGVKTAGHERRESARPAAAASLVDRLANWLQRVKSRGATLFGGHPRTDADR